MAFLLCIVFMVVNAHSMATHPANLGMIYKARVLHQSENQITPQSNMARHKKQNDSVSSTTPDCTQFMLRCATTNVISLVNENIRLQHQIEWLQNEMLTEKVKHKSEIGAFQRRVMELKSHGSDDTMSSSPSLANAGAPSGSKLSRREGLAPSYAFFQFISSPDVATSYLF